MYFSFNEDSNLDTLSNYFNTFGLFSQTKNISSSSKQLMYDYAKKICFERKKIDLDSSPIQISLLEGSIWENYPEVQNFFLQPDVLNVLKSLLGKNWIYIGSDFNVFSSLQTHPWHRDWRLRMPILKIGYYLLQNNVNGGELRYIPGSQKITDQYAKLIQKGTNLPHLMKNPGGFNENNYFPLNKTYSQFNQNNNNACEIPHSCLNLNNNDQFVYFDLRGFHCGTVTNPPSRRIMFSGLFTINPFDDSIDLKKMGIKETPEQLANDLAEVLLIDRKFHGLEKVYDKNGKLPLLPKNHLLELNFKEGNEEISFYNKKNIKINLLNFNSKNLKYSSGWLNEYLDQRSKIYFEEN